MPFSTKAAGLFLSEITRDATNAANIPNHGVSELFSYKGNPNVGENDILLLCKANTAGTAFRGSILGHRSLDLTTADTSQFSASIDWVVSSTGNARGRFDVFQLAAVTRFDVVQFDAGGVRYLGLRSISSQIGAPLRLSHVYFTGTRTPEALAFTVVAAANASNVTPVADITNLQNYRWQHNTGDVLVQLSGTTAQRPTDGNYPGRPYFDTTLGQTIYRNGANNGWVAPTVSAV